MEFEVLQNEVFRLAREGRAAEAENYMLGVKSEFHGRSLGRWHWLFSQVIQRNRPADRDAFLATCSEAAKLLQGEQADLCDLYVTQTAAVVTWGEWRTARTYIRRLRAMFRRHPSNYDVQRLQGVVLYFEGSIERIAGNYSRAIGCLSSAIEDMSRYLNPVDETARSQLIAMSYADIADCYLHLGEHGKAVEYLSKTELNGFPRRERCRYFYVQSRYWLALGNADRAADWLTNTGANGSWEPDWPALITELEADIAKMKGDSAAACDLLRKALTQITPNNPSLKSRIDQKLQLCERMQAK